MREFWHRLAGAAIRAPSGDNCQPWRFDLQGDTLLLYLDDKEAASFFDVGLRASLISAGAALTNMRVAAAAQARALQVDYPDQWPAQGRAVLTVRALPAEDAAGQEAAARLGHLLPAVQRRTVNRRPCLPAWLPASAAMRVLQGPGVPGMEVDLYRTPREIVAWARVVQLSERIRYSHPVIHRELMAKIRFSQAEARATGTGLEITRLGAGPLAWPLLRLIRSPRRMRFLSYLGLGRMLAEHGRLTALASGGIVLVSMGDDQPASWIRAGEESQRLWLNAAHWGLQVQPMTIALYLALRYRLEGTGAFLPGHLPILREMARRIERLAGKSRVPAMLFRVGYGLPFRDTAVRKPLESFWLRAGIDQEAACTGSST